MTKFILMTTIISLFLCPFSFAEEKTKEKIDWKFKTFAWTYRAASFADTQTTILGSRVCCLEEANPIARRFGIGEPGNEAQSYALWAVTSNLVVYFDTKLYEQGKKKTALGILIGMIAVHGYLAHHNYELYQERKHR